MLFSILYAFPIKYPVHAYTVMPWGSLCSTTFSFTPTFLPSYSSEMVEVEGEKVLGRTVALVGCYSLPGLGLELHVPVRARILVLQPVVAVGLQGGSALGTASLGPLLSTAGSYQGWAAQTCFGSVVITSVVTSPFGTG